MFSGPRLTAPTAKLLARSISSTAPVSGSKTTTTFLALSSSAPLSKKYAHLLRERGLDCDHPRHMYTSASNRPHTAPRRVRLMQSFATSAPRPFTQTQRRNMDFAVLPSPASLERAAADPYSRIRVPLTPDNFEAAHAPEMLDAPLPLPEICVVAAHPEVVSPSALTEVEGMGADGVELGFVHHGGPPAPAPSASAGVLKGIWKGLNDAFGAADSNARVAV